MPAGLATAYNQKLHVYCLVSDMREHQACFSHAQTELATEVVTWNGGTCCQYKTDLIHFNELLESNYDHDKSVLTGSLAG
jgi:hypothetical protein